MKVNIIVNKKKEILGYRSQPLDLTQPVIELEEFPKDFSLGDYKYENEKIVKKVVSEKLLNNKYSKDKLLKAFTEYRNNVIYGSIIEDEATHQEIIKWFNAVNNDDINSINNPPQSILKYLEGKSWI